MQQLFTAILFMIGLGFGLVQAHSSPVNHQLSEQSDSSLNRVVLRQIGGFCNNPKPGVTCLPYSEMELDSINEFFKANHQEITEIVIENPSYIIYDLDFKYLNNLEVLVIFGNDYNTDAIKQFPKQLLKLPNLERIEFEGVRFDLDELARIKNKYSEIEIIGEIEDYNY